MTSWKWMATAPACVLLVLAAGAITGVWSQHRLNTAVVPVEAVVIEARAESHVRKNSKSHRTYLVYEPAVLFSYRMNGADRHSKRVFAVHDEGPDSWAQRVMAQYPKGSTVTAWCDPAEPDRAFLVREYRWGPYGWALFIVAAVGSVAWLWFRVNAQTEFPAPPAQAGEGLFRLSPAMGIADGRKGNLMAAVVFLGPGGWLAGHYFLHAAPPFSPSAWFMSAGMGGLGLLFVGLFIYYWRMGQGIGDAELYVANPGFFLGETVNVVVDQLARGAMRVNQISVGLLATEIREQGSGRSHKTVTTDIHADWTEAAKDLDLVPGQRIRLPVSLKIPAERPPTTPKDSKANPTNRWRLEVKLSIPRRPDYHAAYPILVERPEELE